MAIIVQKFGGTSVGSTARIKEIIPIIKSEILKKNQVIVVVSAMAGATNQLITLCNEVSDLTNDSQMAEYDVALSSGEIVTSALVALALTQAGLRAESIQAWQVPIIANDFFAKALVESVETYKILWCLQEGVIPVIAGFQGITKGNRVVTLGRGGTDTTAALIAASVKAERCDIYTDVEGVYSADPRIVHNAKKIEVMDLEEMLELASSGAKVLHPRSIEVAMRYEVPIRVLSSFSNASGTLIKVKDKNMEHRIITAITSNKNLLKISIGAPLVSFSMFCSCLAIEKIHLEFAQNRDEKGNYNIIVPLSDQNRVTELLQGLRKDKQIASFDINSSIATLSIVGYGIKNDSLFVGGVLRLLENKDIEVMMMQVYEVKLSLLIHDKDTEKAIKLLHDYFELGQ